jgi:elongation factor 1-beta
MKLLEESVRAIHWDGLVWGLSKLVPVGYGVSKLQVCIAIIFPLASNTLTPFFY